MPGQWEDMEIGQDGYLLAVGTGFQMTPDQEILLVAKRPDGSEFGGNCFIGEKELWWERETFEPGKYVVYVVREGDLTLNGLYNARLDISPRPPGYVQNVQFQVGPQQTDEADAGA